MLHLYILWIVTYVAIWSSYLFYIIWNMTDLQLKIQQRADKTLSFWCFISWDNWANKWFECMVRVDYEWWERFIVTESWMELWLNAPTWYYKKYEIIWHPMNRWRLCYIVRVCHEKKIDHTMFDRVSEYHMKYDSEVLQWDVLTRPEDFQKRVLAFLESLPSDLLSKV